MKNNLLLVILFCIFSYKINSQESPLGKLKSGVHKFAPFHLIKNTAEKISTFGLDKLFWGATSLFIVNEAYKSGVFDKNYNNEDVSVNNSNLKRIIAKGQTHLEGLDETEARRRALDDALYFAAVKGGVKVHGFSTIDNGTSIKENFTVKPDSKILDYKILTSYKKDDIYIVEVEAIVGNISRNTNCRIRESINIKEFKGSRTINTNLPQDIDKYIHILSNQISNNLKYDKKVNYTNNKKEFYNFNKEGFDMSFDYISLVNGTNQVGHGDFILIPSLKIYKTKIYPKTFLIEDNRLPKIESYKILDTDAIRVEILIELFNGVSNTKLDDIKQKYLIPINTDSNFEIIKLLTKADREYINNEFMNIASDIANIIKTKMLCEPIEAKLEFVNQSLQVPLGTNHGLRKNQLAVIESDTNNWTMLSISDINFNRAILTPLNASIVLEKLSGKQTRFLE